VTCSTGKSSFWTDERKYRTGDRIFHLPGGSPEQAKIDDPSYPWWGVVYDPVDQKSCGATLPIEGSIHS
jgi:hypothetical protein